VSAPLVVKLGGDALATPERIAAAARHLAARHAAGPVVAVASARRGVTDHLLGLVEQVRDSVAAAGRPGPDGLASADRAVASGEVVSASLLAVALDRLGIAAAAVDAREAGLGSDGHAGRARLTRVRPTCIEALLARGIVPVVAGFQGWHRGRTTTLGRGGSDTTAVALAVALGAEACELVKDAPGLLDADPRLVSSARLLPRVSHRFVTQLAGAGARVMHLPAAALAERAGLTLRFVPLIPGAAAGTVVERGPGDARAAAIAVRPGRSRFTAQLTGAPARALARRVRERSEAAGLHPEVALQRTATGAWLELIVDADELEECLDAAAALLAGHRRPTLVAGGLSSVTVVVESETAGLPLQVALQEAVARSGAAILAGSREPHRQGYLVTDREAPALARALHEALTPGHAGDIPRERTAERSA
jgi:aspartate kinase